ncbi:MAG TPA: hypothetical protein VNN08_18050, partial [Thermoanaerobaculia bacterium]|nr:hypothetical protein [Thermoanaerobaculia bacterium]
MTRIREPKPAFNTLFSYEMTVLPSLMPTTAAGTGAGRLNPALGKSPSSRFPALVTLSKSVERSVLDSGDTNG